MKLNWNFHWDGRGGGGGVKEKIPSVGDVWMFSGITHWVGTNKCCNNFNFILNRLVSDYT